MIEAILKLLTEVGKYANTQNETKRAREILSLKKQLQEEVAKGQNSDDGVIEQLQSDIKLNEEALYNEIMTRHA